MAFFEESGSVPRWPIPDQYGPIRSSWTRQRKNHGQVKLAVRLRAGTIDVNLEERIRLQWQLMGGKRRLHRLV